jgi:hypothetical protein
MRHSSSLAEWHNSPQFQNESLCSYENVSEVGSLIGVGEGAKEIWLLFINSEFQKRYDTLAEYYKLKTYK